LSLARVADAEGTPWCLLGLAVQSQPGRNAPIGDIATAATAAVPARAQAWSGRWVLIGGGRVHQDCAGLLGCYYRSTDGSDLWISSSPALLAKLPCAAPAPRIGARLRWGPRKGMNWYPAPASGFDGVSALLVSQTISLAPGSRPDPRPLLQQPDGIIDYEKQLDYLQTSLITIFRNLAERSPEIWLACSAGIDSRLLLATAHASGVEVRTFTQQLPFPFMQIGDRRLPPVLSKAVGFEHRLIHRGTSSRSRAALWEEHTAGHSCDVDRSLFVRGQWGPFGAQATVVRGGVFEIGRSFYVPQLPPMPDATEDQMVDRILRKYTSDRYQLGSIPHHDGIRSWVRWINEHPDPVDWRDRLYWEQRAGAWLSAIEHGLDLTGSDRVEPANCGLLIGCMQSVAEDVRTSRTMMFDLIERMAPQLLAYPVNPPNSRVRRLSKSSRRRLSHYSYRIASALLVGTWWQRRSRPAQIALIVGAVAVGFAVVGFADEGTLDLIEPIG
jgi:hypothetical protein